MKTLFSLLLLAILLATGSTPTSAIQPGQPEWDNTVLSFEDAKKAADAGNAYAQAVVSTYYSLGWKTEKNVELALKYSLASAKAGHPLGIYRVGATLRSGDGTAKDEQQGLTLQKNSFDGLNKMGGNPYAITSLGVMLFQGKVVKENKKEAARLYKIAADMGYAPAQFNYAMCAEAGQGLQKDASVKEDYLRRACEQSYPLALQAENLVSTSNNSNTTPSALGIVEKQGLKESSLYVGDYGGDKSVFEINWHDDGTVSGSVTRAQNLGGKWTTQFVGENKTDGELRIVTIYVLPNGKRERSWEILLKKTIANGKIYWRGYTVRSSTREQEEIQLVKAEQALLPSGSKDRFINEFLFSSTHEKIEKWPWDTNVGNVVNLTEAKETNNESLQGKEIKTVIQRSPDVATAECCAVNKSASLFCVVEGGCIAVWELQSGRLIGTIKKPFLGECKSIQFVSDSEVLLTGDKIYPQQDYLINTLSQSVKTRRTFSSSSSINSIQKANDKMGDVINLKDERKVRFHFSEEDFLVSIRGYSIYSPDGTLIETLVDNGRVGFKAKLASALGLPIKFISDEKSKDVVTQISGSGFFDISSSMSFLRSWRKWGCRSVLYVVELNAPTRVAFIDDAKVRYEAEIPGVSFLPLRYISSYNDKRAILSWSLSKGFPGSATPPKPCVVNLETLEVRYIDIPKGSTPINARLLPSDEIAMVTGKIPEIADEGMKMSISKQIFGTSGTPPREIGPLVNISPYTGGEDLFFKPDILVHMVREVTKEKGDEERLNSAYKKLGLQPSVWNESFLEFRKKVQDTGSSRLTASWGSDTSAASSRSNAMLLKNGNELLARIKPATGDDFISSQIVGNNLVVVTVEAIYSLNLTNFSEISSWRIPQMNSHWNSSGSGDRILPPDEYCSINTTKREIYLTSQTGAIYIIKVAADGTLNELAHIEFQLSGEPIVILPDNLYANLGGKVAGIHFSDGTRTFPFEQFDLRLNRPDIVLDRLEASPEAIAIAQELREKRLKRMGVTEDMLKPDFHIPEIKLASEVPAATDSRAISLQVKASDSNYPLERLRVYVNDVPVSGKEGESLRSLNSQSLDRTISVNLSAGKNKIQVSVLNSAGAESLYATAEVTCTATATKPKLYVVAMGVSIYANQQFNLKYAAKDAEDLARKLKARAGDAYGEVKELLLKDGEVTKDALSKVREFLKPATVDDSVILFMAGHGLLDDKYDYYFGTSDMDFNNPAGRGIAFDDMDDILADLPSRKKSLLMDTCHAGELDADEKKVLAAADASATGAIQLASNNAVAVRAVGTRGMAVKGIEGAKGKSEWYERISAMFVDLRRGSGSTILSSSAGAEYAFESGEQKNGLFTYAVLEALDGKNAADADKDGQVTMKELCESVKKRVQDLSGGKQTPNTRRLNLESDFTLASSVPPASVISQSIIKSNPTKQRSDSAAELEVFPAVVEMNFPQGYLVYSDDGKLLKTVPGPTSASIHARATGKSFASAEVYLSDWSYERMQKGEMPNWIVSSFQNGAEQTTGPYADKPKEPIQHGLVVYPSNQETVFPNGYDVYSDDGKLLKTVPGPTSTLLRGHTTGKSFASGKVYLSDWSYERTQKNEKPNWIKGR